MGAAASITTDTGFRYVPSSSTCRLSGAQLDQAALAAAYAAENWAEVDRLVSDDVVRRHAACGTPAEVRATLDDYRAIGLDEVILGGIDDAASIAAALAAARGEKA